MRASGLPPLPVCEASYWQDVAEYLVSLIPAKRRTRTAFADDIGQPDSLFWPYVLDEVGRLLRQSWQRDPCFGCRSAMMLSLIALDLVPEAREALVLALRRALGKLRETECEGKG